MKALAKKVLKSCYSFKYWIRRNISNKLSKKRNILMLTFYEAYDEHVIKFYDDMKKDKHHKYYLNYGRVGIKLNNNIDKAKEIVGDRKIKIIGRGLKSFVFLMLKSWDLIILPDHLLALNIMLKHIPSLFIYHGTSTNLHDGELYAYKKSACIVDGKCKYTKMLENNSLLADYMNSQEEFKGKVEYVSSVNADLIFSESENRDKLRIQLGVGENDLFIFIYSTWNKESLFRKLGEEFLEQIKKIKEINGQRVVFALSIHPKEYKNYNGDNTSVPMGYLIDKCACENIIIRKPGSDWMPYIIGADIVIGDKSSMLDFAIMANKKIILSETDLHGISDLSIVSKAYEKLPIIYKGDNLEQCLNNCTESYENNNIEVLRKMIFEEKGYYKNKINQITYELLYKERK